MNMRISPGSRASRESAWERPGGFLYVALDLDGNQMGSMNKALGKEK